MFLNYIAYECAKRSLILEEVHVLIWLSKILLKFVTYLSIVNNQKNHTMVMRRSINTDFLNYIAYGCAKRSIILEEVHVIIWLSKILLIKTKW